MVDMAYPEDIPDGASPGESGHVTDHNKLSTAATNLDERLHAVEISPPSGLTTEQIQDMLGTFLVAGTNVTITYNDVSNTLTISASGSGAATADAVSVVASGFNGHLATSDNTMQKVAQKLDDLPITSMISGLLSIHAAPEYMGHEAVSISLDSSGFNGNLATTDNNVQELAQKVDDLVLGGAPTKESIQDLLGTDSFYGNSGISITYDDTNNRWSFTTIPSWKGTERTGVDGLVGTTPRVGQHRIYNDSGSTRVINAVRAAVGTVDTGTTLIVDVKKEGTSIFSSTGARPTIATSTNSNKSTAMGAASVWNDGQYITVDVPQAGAAHANLAVNIEWSS
jgi:hypothetical protein